MIRPQRVFVVQGGARWRRQSGAAAIEFAFVFPLLFALMYGTIVYGYVFFAQQTINMLAQECAKVAVGYATVGPDGKLITPNYADVANKYIAQSGLAAIFPKPPTATAQPFTIQGENSGQPGIGQTITVTLDLKDSKDAPIFPQINLNMMGLGAVPPIPAQLTASASVRVS